MNSLRFVVRWTTPIAAGLLAILLLVMLFAWGFIHASLPVQDGKIATPDVQAPVSIQRDAEGAVLITGKRRDDVAFATGFVHAQERFFQMDLMRRSAAGELAELFGAKALELDREHRLYRFRDRANAALAQVSAEQRTLLQRYAEGVNAGLAAMRARPFEYGVLMQQPKRWTEADTLLAVWSMYFDLQGNLDSRKFARGWLREHMTDGQAAFLLPTESAFDAPLDADASIMASAALPASAPSWFVPVAKPRQVAAVESTQAVGSNGWAIAGWRSKTGSAIVSNDMHLNLGLPNTWYRLELAFPDAHGHMRHVAGVSLPGTPLVIVGSNEHIAWGFTNSYGDYLDLVEVQFDPQDSLRYRDIHGWKMAHKFIETFNIRGAQPETMTVIETDEGPVQQIDKRFYAIHWVADMPGAVNVGLEGLEQADDVRDAEAIAARAGIPTLNFIVGDSRGHIGWTIAGPLPGRDASAAASFPYRADQQQAWTTLRAPDDYPRVNDPPSGQLWTANNRQLMGDEYRKIGDGGADIGARARQIRDDLHGLGDRVDEAAGYEVLADDRALFIAPWRQRALAALDDAALANRPDRQAFRRLLETSWTGRASVDSVGYRLSRMFMDALYEELFGSVDETLHGLDRNASYAKANPRWSVVVARLIDEQPANWLPQGESWHDVELRAIDLAIRHATQTDGALTNATWGRRNRTAIRHPFAAMWPSLDFVLGAPEEPIPGDANMPRVAGPHFGPSERMVVSPGHEGEALFDMPGGQSGNPLSPQFLAGHEAWVAMRPGPLLPGKSSHELLIVPQQR
nr:penicillin acylase family protein [Trinickia fusca]